MDQKFQTKAALYHLVDESSTELDFCRMMMPEDPLQNIIEATNQQVEMCFKPLDYEQLQQFFGVARHDYCNKWQRKQSIRRTEPDS